MPTREENEAAAVEQLLDQLRRKKITPAVLSLGAGLDGLITTARKRSAVSVNASGGDVTINDRGTRIVVRRRDTLDAVHALERHLWLTPQGARDLGAHQNAFYPGTTSERHNLQLGWGSILAARRHPDLKAYVPIYLFTAAGDRVAQLTAAVPNAGVKVRECGRVTLRGWALEKGIVSPKSYAVYQLDNGRPLEKVLTRSVQSCSAAFVFPRQDPGNRTAEEYLVFAHTNNALPNPLPATLDWLMARSDDFRELLGQQAYRTLVTIYPSMVEVGQYAPDGAASDRKREVLVLNRSDHVFAFNASGWETIFEPHDAYGLDLSAQNEVKIVGNYGHYRAEIEPSSVLVWNSLYNSMAAIREVCRDILPLRDDADLRTRLRQAADDDARVAVGLALVDRLVQRLPDGWFGAGATHHQVLAGLAKIPYDGDLSSLPDDKRRGAFAQYMLALLAWSDAVAATTGADQVRKKTLQDFADVFREMEGACIRTHAVFEMGGATLNDVFDTLWGLGAPLEDVVDLRSAPEDTAARFGIDFQKIAPARPSLLTRVLSKLRSLK